jgi:hypothetical protein
MRNTADVTGGEPIAVRSQSILGMSTVNALVYLVQSVWGPGRVGTISMEERERCYSLILSRTPHEALIIISITRSCVMFGTKQKNSTSPFFYGIVKGLTAFTPEMDCDQ